MFFSFPHSFSTSSHLFLPTYTSAHRFGQLSKYTSAMYKCLTPEEKELWDHRAAEDKARYDAEMSAYVPPPGHDPQGILIEELRPKEKKPRKVKDPNAPKRARGMVMDAACATLLATPTIDLHSHILYSFRFRRFICLFHAR